MNNFLIGDLVRPSKDKLTSSGAWWEYFLYEDGWNELPDENKYGIVVLKLGNTYDVYFESLKHLSHSVWQDEIKPLQ